MADQKNLEDRLADRNLEMIGRRLDLPEPTELQQARWKQTSTADWEREALNIERERPGSIPVGALKQDGFVRRHRRLTIATSAVAACIVLGVLLITPRGSTVEAGTIIESLRRTLLDGFQVVFENIGDEGVYVNGRVLVALRPIGGTKPLNGTRGLDPARLEVESVYAEANLLGDGFDDDMAGLDWRVNLALSDQSQWAFLKLSGMPNRIPAEEPLVQLIIGLTNNGLLLDLDGLRDPTVPEDHSNQADALPLPARNADGEKSAANDFAQLIKDFLIGRAGAEQIDRLLVLIASTARDIRLVETEPGLQVLTVGEFRLDTLESGYAQLADMTLEVRYRVGVGIESARLTHIGAYDGTLRLAPLGDGIAPILLDKRSFVHPQTTIVWKLYVLKPLLQLILG